MWADQGLLQGMDFKERVPALKSNNCADICAPDHEKPVRARESLLRGTVCSLEQVRGTGEAELARLASLQHGCSHRRQLLVALGRGALAQRLNTRRYRPLHRAVYVIDPLHVDEWTSTMAAILLFAGDAVASHRTAGAIWEMVAEIPTCPQVTVVGRGAHAQADVQICRATSLAPRDVRWRRDLPVTSPARTAVDLAGDLTAFELEDVLACCQEKRLASPDEIREALARAPYSVGARMLRALLDRGGFARTRSHYERKLLALIAAAGLPRPLTNHKLVGHEVDMVWHDKQLVVEFDGFRYHGDRKTFERDRRRDQDLVASGYRVMRVTARQLEEEPFAVIARLAAALAI